MADLDKLRAAINKAWATPFPEHPDSDELDDLMMELAELDPHIVGIGTTVLHGGRQEYPITGLDELEATVAAIQPQSDKDAQILQQCKDILAYLRAITDSI